MNVVDWPMLVIGQWASTGANQLVWLDDMAYYVRIGSAPFVVETEYSTYISSNQEIVQHTSPVPSRPDAQTSPTPSDSTATPIVVSDPESTNASKHAL